MSLLLETLARIEQTISIDAAEYVPAIADVFTIIDQARKQHAQASAPSVQAAPMTREAAVALAQKHLRAHAGKNFNRFRNPPPDWIIDAILEASALPAAQQPQEPVTWVQPVFPCFDAMAMHTRMCKSWMDIAMAPKDGTDILLSNGVEVAEGRWVHEEPYVRERRDAYGRYIDQDESDGFDGWIDWSGGMRPEPTHWMPKPPPPAIDAAQPAEGQKP